MFPWRGLGTQLSTHETGGRVSHPLKARGCLGENPPKLRISHPCVGSCGNVQRPVSSRREHAHEGL